MKGKKGFEEGAIVLFYTRAQKTRVFPRSCPPVRLSVEIFASQRAWGRAAFPRSLTCINGVLPDGRVGKLD